MSDLIEQGPERDPWRPPVEWRGGRAGRLVGYAAAAVLTAGVLAASAYVPPLPPPPPPPTAAEVEARRRAVERMARFSAEITCRDADDIRVRRASSDRQWMLAVYDVEARTADGAPYGTALIEIRPGNLQISYQVLSTSGGCRS